MFLRGDIPECSGWSEKALRMPAVFFSRYNRVTSALRKRAVALGAMLVISQKSQGLGCTFLRVGLEYPLSGHPRGDRHQPASYTILSAHSN
jgi:hypothetical protein